MISLKGTVFQIILNVSAALSQEDREIGNSEQFLDFLQNRGYVFFNKGCYDI